MCFLRDNIFRAVQTHDPDYSRDIEGDVLRIHWDEYHLFNMICNRLKKVFNIEQEKNLDIWNKKTAKNISGKNGFRKCLRRTLYRPRDLLVLLNKAFNNAMSHNSNQIVDEDIDCSAKDISSSRLDDLRKEYNATIPGLKEIIQVFHEKSPKLTALEANNLIDKLFKLEEDITPLLRQTLAIMQSPVNILKTLFSIGFIGIFNKESNSFVFCHDGRDPGCKIENTTSILIHPCYWLALNLQDQGYTPESRDEIHDEYDIEVSSETPKMRKQKLGQLISELDSIPEGKEHASSFEQWCYKSLHIIFAKGLVNLELHPNGNATQRRDIVGRNTGATESWKRILDDHKVRQVIFEIKNFSKDLGRDEYRQMLSYLSNGHGKLGFIINRSQELNLKREKELQWVKEIYYKHEKRIVIKLTAKFLIKCLSKLRNPQKHDAPDKLLNSLLDTYQRRYLN